MGRACRGPVTWRARRDGPRRTPCAAAPRPLIPGAVFPGAENPSIADPDGGPRVAPGLDDTSWIPTRARHYAGRGARPQMDPRPDAFSELTNLLHAELALVGELRDALARQRAGVANDDPVALEASADELERVVVRVEGARRRRATLVGAITGDERCSLARFEERVATPLPAGFGRVRAALRDAAHGAAIDLSINRALLRHAADAGEGSLRRLFSSSADSPAICGAGPRAAPPGSGPDQLPDRSP